MEAFLSDYFCAESEVDLLGRAFGLRLNGGGVLRNVNKLNAFAKKYYIWLCRWRIFYYFWPRYCIDYSRARAYEAVKALLRAWIKAWGGLYYNDLIQYKNVEIR